VFFVNLQADTLVVHVDELFTKQVGDSVASRLGVPLDAKLRKEFDVAEAQDFGRPRAGRNLGLFFVAGFLEHLAKPVQ